MAVQMVALSFKGIVIASSTAESIETTTGAVHVVRRNPLFSLLDPHSVTIVLSGSDAIYDYPVTMYLEEWAYSLNEPLNSIQDYIASFLEYLEQGPNFLDRSHEGSYWSDEFIRRHFVFFAEDILIEFRKKTSAVSALAGGQARQEILLQLLDLELKTMMSKRRVYEAHSVEVSKSFLESDIEKNGYEESLISSLFDPFNDYVNDTQQGNFSISDALKNKILDLGSVLISSYDENFHSPTQLLFAGYGSGKSVPEAGSIFIDGVTNKVQFYSVPSLHNNKWLGNHFSNQTSDKLETVRDSKSLPFWILHPSTNEPVVLISTGMDTAPRITNDFLANALSLSDLKALVEGLVRQNIFAPLFQLPSESKQFLGSGIEILTITPRHHTKN